MRGYDIDGVLADGTKPIKPYVVISGRLPDEWDRTVQQIGTKYPIYLRPYGDFGDRDLAGEWKSFIINALGVTEFYDDDPLQLEIIAKNCPNCKTIKVGNWT